MQAPLGELTLDLTGSSPDLSHQQPWQDPLLPECRFPKLPLDGIPLPLAGPPPCHSHGCNDHCQGILHYEPCWLLAALSVARLLIADTYEASKYKAVCAMSAGANSRGKVVIIEGSGTLLHMCSW